jgi:transcriptional regulator with XRE-family HTH domain
MVKTTFKGESNVTLGKMIREKRIERGLTQQQLADKVYVTRQTISKWELEKSQPDQISLYLIENALQFKWHHITEEGERSERTMSRIRKNIASTVFGLFFFGILFLPIRIIGVIIRKNWRNPLLQYIGIPVAIGIYSMYMHSLTVKAFYVVLICLIVLYLSIRIYFSSNEMNAK